jgi:phosphohistidine phosphatase
MDLFILRHGEAEPRAAGIVDVDRALTSHGREEIKRIAAWARSAGHSFDLIATSPLKRAEETAEIVAASPGEKKKEKVEVWPSLAPDGDRDALVGEISRQSGIESLLLVGHEPLLSTFISRVIAGDDRASILLAKGGMARIKNVTVSEGLTGDLHWLITPRQARMFR